MKKIKIKVTHTRNGEVTKTDTHWVTPETADRVRETFRKMTSQKREFEVKMTKRISPDLIENLRKMNQDHT